jgi:hypothetical protein
LICDNHEYNDGGYNKDLSRWKVSWEPSVKNKGVLKNIQPGQKSIAEQMKIKMNLTLTVSKNTSDNANGECDTFEKEEEEHETKRKKGKGKLGLSDKGCLLDVSKLFNE